MKSRRRWSLAIVGALVVGAAAFFAGRAMAVGTATSKLLVYCCK